MSLGSIFSLTSGPSSKGPEDKRLLAAVFEVLPELVSYIDEQRTYRYVNAAYARWFSLSPRDLIGRTMKDILGPEAFAVASDYVDAALRGERQDFEVELPYRICGERIVKTVQAAYVPDQDAFGKTRGFYAVVSDLTSLKAAELLALERGHKLEMALAKSQIREKSFRAILEGSPLGIVQLDSELRYVSANPAHLEFVGYSETELQRLSLLDVVHRDDLQNVAATFSDIFEAGHVKRFECRFVQKSGAVVWGLLTGRAVDSDGEASRRIVGVVEDVTELRAKDELLKIAQAKLFNNAKLASLGQMAGGIAHEINNPLALIKGRAELLGLRLETGDVAVGEALGELE